MLGVELPASGVHCLIGMLSQCPLPQRMSTKLRFSLHLNEESPLLSQLLVPRSLLSLTTHSIWFTVRGAGSTGMQVVNSQSFCFSFFLIRASLEVSRILENLCQNFIGGKPLLELNRILRPGGFFIWSATPVYKDDERHRNVWNCAWSLTQNSPI